MRLAWSAPGAQPRSTHYIPINVHKAPFILPSVLLFFSLLLILLFLHLNPSPTLLNKLCTVSQSPLKILTIHGPIISPSYLLHGSDWLSFKLCLLFFNSPSISSWSVLVFGIFLFITYLSDFRVCVLYLFPCYFAL